MFTITQTLRSPYLGQWGLRSVFFTNEPVGDEQGSAAPSVSRKSLSQALDEAVNCREMRCLWPELGPRGRRKHAWRATQQIIWTIGAFLPPSHSLSGCFCHQQSADLCIHALCLTVFMVVKRLRLNSSNVCPFQTENASQMSRAEQSRRSSDDNWDDGTKRGNHEAVSGVIKQPFTNQTLYFSVEEDLHQPVMTWALHLPRLLFTPSLSTSKHEGRWQQ